MIAQIRLVWRDALALVFALADRRTPSGPKVAAAIALAYAIFPLDILPDAVPILGLTDDFLVVPTILALAARTLPIPVLHDAQAKSLGLQKRLPWLLPLLGTMMVLGFIGIIWGMWLLLRH